MRHHAVGQGTVRFCASLLLVATVFIAGTASAYAQRVWCEEPDPDAYSVASSSGVHVGDVGVQPGVTLERRLLWEWRPPGESYFEPFSASLLSNGNILMASRTNEVFEVNRAKQIVWSYTRLNDNPDLINVYSAQRLPNGNTLITDRRADFVIEVTPDKRVVWRYGVNPDSLEPGSLMDPFSATRLPNGNTLIVDNRGGNRVIEVRTSDYDPDQPNLGYTADSIVWQYGETGVPGIGPGRLASPRNAQRLLNGNTLITDSSDRNNTGNRVIEVTPGGEIVWQHGIAGEAGVDEERLHNPSAAQRLGDGNTVIVEEDVNRMIEVSVEGEIVDWYGGGKPVAENGALLKPRGIQRTESGTSIIADQGNQRVAEIGYVAIGTFVSNELSLDLPGVRKVITSIDVISEEPTGTSVILEYSLDGSEWRAIEGSSELGGGQVGTRFRYRLKLASQSAAHTPVVRRVCVSYDVVPDDWKPPGAESGETPGPTAGGPEERDGEGTVRPSGTPSEPSAVTRRGTGGPTTADGSDGELAGAGSAAASAQTKKVGGSIASDLSTAPEADPTDSRFVHGALLESATGSVPAWLAGGSGAGYPEGSAVGLALVAGAYAIGLLGSPISRGAQRFFAGLFASGMRG